MNKGKLLFTSESVTMGHPDKMADQISDAILDAILAQDPNGRVACETLVKTGVVVVAGEITTTAQVYIPDIVRNAVKDIGYCDSSMGFDYKTCGVQVMLDRQSPDISRGVTPKGKKQQGAGDQGLMFGFACNQTPELMPAPILFAHRLCEKLAEVRRSGLIPYLLPDGKSQVTVEYMDGVPVRIHTVVVSTQHLASASHKTIRKDVIDKVIRAALPSRLLDSRTIYHVNPTGKFVVGGPQGDCGLTGRKIIVDSYGGWGRHGGGAFSGKDPSKVDRSANYYARYVAKNVVAAGLARCCEIQVAYAIGVAKPLAVYVHSEGTGVLPDSDLARLVQRCFDFRPAAMIEELDLKRPIYRLTAAHGHFGRNLKQFTWERTDRASLLRKTAGL
ncbi:MAG: methionine adenosyltransferase [Planctomycetota bacterium]